MLSGQIGRRVGLLSLVAIVGILAAIFASLTATLQGAQRRLDEAGSAATRAFDQFLGSIKSDIRSLSDALSASPQVNTVFQRTLDRQPAIFELTLVDLEGHVLFQRRRVGGITDQVVTEQPWLETVQAGRVYLGPVDYEEYGVPFADMAVAVLNQEGDTLSTLVAEVDLTTLWNTSIGLTVGETGYVYITDEKGNVLAYRNLQLVRQGITLQDVAGQTPQELAQSGLNLCRGIAGRKVLASSVPLAVVPWYAVIEQPIGEALYPFVIRSALLLVALLLVGIVVYSINHFTRHQLVAPLRSLLNGVKALQQGRMEHRVQIETSNELGILADTLNTMAGRLKDIIATLEQRVADRTRGLQAAAEVGHATTSVLDVDQLLRQAVDLVREQFGLYYVGLLLLDRTQKFAVLQAAAGEAGEISVRQGIRLRVDDSSMVSWCMAHTQPRVAPDISQDDVYATHPLLPEGRSAVALPLMGRGGTIGALYAESVEQAAFDDAHVTVMQTMADQIAVAIENARLYETAQRELTERKRAEQTLKEYSGRLEEMVEERTQDLRDAQERLIRQEKLAFLGQLAGGVGHELRNPLGAIRNAASLLKTAIEESQSEANDILRILEREVAASERIISSLLDFARAKPPLRQKVDLTEVVRGVLSRVDLPENVQVVDEMDENMPAVLADPDQLGQIFENILVNGVQAMPDGGRLTVRSETPGPDSVTVSFADTGIGIPEQNMEEIFEPLFTTKVKGIGLGLAIVNTLLEGHGGTVEVESTVGKGSVFTVRLPIIGLGTTGPLR
jgi:signal transduction histidine kinase/HAMP domain-containing protein